MADTQYSPAVTPRVTAGWLTLPDFAAELGKSERTARRWVDRGLPVIRVGNASYIDPAAAREWFRAGMPAPKPAPRGRRAA